MLPFMRFSSTLPCNILYLTAMGFLLVTYHTTISSSYVINKISPSSDIQGPEDYESIIASLQGELFTHSALKNIGRERPCLEIIDKNATMIKSIGKTTRQLVDIDPSATFSISYCSAASDEANYCAVDSTCATIYRWKKAPIHQEFLAGSGFEFLLEDEILVPMGCTCVINALKPGTPNLPVIIF
ncbi:hypothetical protein DdX_03864 [Ditylenchus destructor]|uniref:Uncharacterized protein n=1 Tax=Ditylenchus destructor TaxID=166010 RepID=A0AAD4NEG4_9BILA|nr:hypothetical protein DdX_03864 [Ditylenchus destructor]